MIRLRRVLILVAAMGVSARADEVVFDFNSLENRDRDIAISAYMTAVYGSDVSTDGARVTDETAVPGGVTDLFIATSFQLLNRGDFEIVFEDIPIISARFQGHVLDPTLSEDFHFFAFNGDTLIDSLTRDEGEEVFDGGLHLFSSPVDRIVISDSGRIDVGIDDLIVQPVPEPATLLLLLTAAGLATRRTWAAMTSPHVI